MKNLITEEFLVHFIAIPTEKKDGKPYYKPLLSVLNNISKIKRDVKNPPIVIIESTLAPKVTDKIIIPFLKKKIDHWQKYSFIGCSKKRLVY